MSRKYNKTFTSLKTVVHDTSILDAQKILVKPFNGQANERTDIIELINGIENENAINSGRLEDVEKEVLGDYIPHNFTTNSTGRSNETEGTAIQLSKAHFINGGVQIQSLQLPYTLALGITDQYCHIQFCDANNEIIKTIVSKNTQSQISGNTGISIWDFEKDAIVPEDYHVARIILSGIKETSEFGITTVFRINVVNNNGVEFDTDECCIWNGAGTSYNYLGDVSLTYGIHTGTLKSQLNEEINSLNEDISEISGNIDEFNNKVSQIEGFKNSTNEKIENIEERIINIEDILDGEFVDKTFTTATTGDTAETAGRGIQLSKNHFIEGGTILKSLSLPYKGADYTRNNQYCHVTFYNESEQPIKKITSADTQSRAYDTSGVSKWTFTENNTLPDDYYYAQIALSGSATDNPNIKTGSQCSTYTINVIRKDGNNVTFDEDICQCYGVNGAVMNYLGDVTVEYQGPGPTLAEIVANNSNRITNLEENGTNKEEIAQLQSDVSELQSKNYAYTDAENVFSSANTFEAPIYTNNIIVDNGAIEFADDGEVILSNGASGWPYTIFMPDKFENGKIYDLGLLTSDVDLSSVVFDGDDTIVQTAEIWFTLGDTIHNIIWPANVIWIDTIDGTMPPLTDNLNYRLSIRKEVKYIVASISYTFKTPLI